MSTFEVKIVKLDGIEPIPGADRIELAVVGGFRSVVRKHELSAGDYVVYIPEGAVVPEYVLERLGLVGKLAGAQKNRVKAVLLQKILSQGIVLPVHSGFGCPDSGPFVIPTPDGSELRNEGDDVGEIMGIVKYEPSIPTSMSGEIYYAGRDVTYAFDIENIKKYPHAFTEGEEVMFTEKLHGTYCQLICIPPRVVASNPNYEHRYHLSVDTPSGPMYFAVASKGRAEEGLCFHWTTDAPNVYLKSCSSHVFRLAEKLHSENQPVTIMGEVFGAGIQDLTYGMVNNKYDFRLFDVRVGYRNNGYFIDADELDNYSQFIGISRVPVVYRGPYSNEIVRQYTDNVQSQIDPTQMSEGIVMSPIKERYDASCGPSGRVKMKSINVVYLARKNKNATEFT